jgi:hypothetical protein
LFDRCLGRFRGPVGSNKSLYEGEDKVVLKIVISSELRVKMISLGISPATVARHAFEKEVRVREELEKLESQTKRPSDGPSRP